MDFLKRIFYKIVILLIELFEDSSVDVYRKSSSNAAILSKVKLLERQYAELLHKYGILDCNLRRWHFWAQLAHESNLMEVRENMNYSMSGLLKIFPKYFTVTQAKKYARKPQLIANKVYANRMGNGDEKSNDGWRYRGGGYIQLTGKDNYRKLSSKIEGLLENPSLITIRTNALLAALEFWKSRDLNTLADNDDIIGITRRINGGTIGLRDRIARYQFLKENLR